VQSAEAGLSRSWVSATFGTFAKGDAVVIVEEHSWMPLALALWNVSADELEYRGKTGQSHDLVHVLDDYLWLEGDGKVPDAPVTDVSAALQQVEGALQAQQAAERAAARAVALRHAEEEQAAFALEAPKQIKRKEKALRTVCKLADDVASGVVQPDEDQSAKIARQGELKAEIETLKARLARVAAGNEPLLPEEEEVAAGQHAEQQEIGDDNSMEAATVEDAVGLSTPSEDHDDDVSVPDPIFAAVSDADNSDADNGPPPLPMDQVLERSVVVALHDSVANKDLPLLLSTLYATHVLPASRMLRNAPPLNVKQTAWKKFAAYMSHLDQDERLLEVESVKAGVQLLKRVDRIHSLYLTYDDAWLLTEADMAVEDEGVRFQTTARAAKAQANAFVVPSRGPQKIVIEQKRVANKNMTVVSALSNFGIALDDELKRAIAKRFSVAVSYAESPDASLGMLLRVQGKYLEELAEVLQDRYGIPKRYISVIKAKGKKKK
jgi:translation initiation factor 2D